MESFDDRRIQSIESRINVRQSHRRTESVMAGRSAIVVEVDAMPDRRCDEAQHLRPIMSLRVLVIANHLVESEVDTKPCAKSLDPRNDTMPAEQIS